MNLSSLSVTAKNSSSVKAALMEFDSWFDAVMKKTVEDMNYEYAPRYLKQVVPVASFKDRCDGILESFVSKYEIHFYEHCNVSEDTYNKEFLIARNGPNMQMKL